MKLTTTDIKAIRTYYGLSQPKLAAKIGVTNQYVSMIEAEQRAVSSNVQSRIIETLRVDETQLIEIRRHYERICAI